MDFPLSDFETVIKKAQKYCAYQERCQWDLEKKFRVWQVVEEIQDEVLADLISQEIKIDFTEYKKTDFGNRAS